MWCCFSVVDPNMVGKSVRLGKLLCGKGLGGQVGRSRLGMVGSGIQECGYIWAYRAISPRPFLPYRAGTRARCPRSGHRKCCCGHGLGDSGRRRRSIVCLDVEEDESSTREGRLPWGRTRGEICKCLSGLVLRAQRNTVHAWYSTRKVSVPGVDTVVSAVGTAT